MGRSVNYLSNADLVLYFDGSFLENEFDWEDFKSNLIYKIKKKLKSYNECDKWDGNETRIFLENELAEIGLSEYCGLCSLSVRVRDDDYDEYFKEGIAKRHIKQIEKSLVKCLENTGVEILNRLGTFSNGCGVFEKANV